MNQQALPDGWISEVDPQSGHPYYVDTRAANPTPQWHAPDNVGYSGGSGGQPHDYNQGNSYGSQSQQHQQPHCTFT